MNKILLIVVIGLLLIGVGYFFWKDESKPETEILTQDEQSQVSEPINHPLITVESPAQNSVISSPLEINGQARGQWYFEATFPIDLYDGNNQKLAEGFATAQGDWMTTEYTPFTAQLNFETPTTPDGKLVFRRSNPSGLPENDDQLEIPIKFQ